MVELKRDTISWLDGDMPFSETFGDHYYSRQDGQAECRHVFMAGNRLPERWSESANFTVGELGFGTGLNFLETWQVWRARRGAGQLLHFVSFEAYPMEEAAIRRALSPWSDLSSLAERLLERWSSLSGAPQGWDLDDQTRLTIIVGDALDGVANWNGKANAWYLDGFAPSRNPGMWSSDLMHAVAGKTADGGTFASYTAAGWVRRNLEAAGFTVEKRPGHVGKREMICGRLSA